MKYDKNVSVWAHTHLTRTWERTWKQHEKKWKQHERKWMQHEREWMQNERNMRGNECNMKGDERKWKQQVTSVDSRPKILHTRRKLENPHFLSPGNSPVEKTISGKNDNVIWGNLERYRVFIQPQMKNQYPSKTDSASLHFLLGLRASKMCLFLISVLCFISGS